MKLGEVFCARATVNFLQLFTVFASILAGIVVSRAWFKQTIAWPWGFAALALPCVVFLLYLAASEMRIKIRREELAGLQTRLRQYECDE